MESKKLTDRIPAHWAVYFSNADCSHMDDKDVALADAWRSSVSEALGGVPTLDYGEQEEFCYLPARMGGSGSAYNVTATRIVPRHRTDSK